MTLTSCSYSTRKLRLNIELFLAIIVLVCYIFSFWIIIRVVRAIERIASKIEKIVDNENTTE